MSLLNYGPKPSGPTHPPRVPPPPPRPVPVPAPAKFLAPARYLAAFVWGVVALGEALVDRIAGRHA